MFIANDGRRDVWTWYEVWQATVTLSAMCAATAYTGAAFDLGEHIPVGP